MVDVNVSISGIIMCCDESLCNLSLGNGYTIEKLSLDSLPFKEKVTDGRGLLITDYFGSRIIEDETVSFICIKKTDTIQINGPSFSPTVHVLSGDDFLCENELAPYMHREMDFLNERVNLLRLVKPGNIGFRDVFFNYSFTTMGIMNNTLNLCSHSQTRNTIANDKYVLGEAEIAKCNNWLNDYSGAPYELLKNCIDEFCWGLEQIDIPTGFEQYTTALEMILLPQNQPGKKQMLANRISAFLGNTSPEIGQIHQQILNFYRFRSESLHEGDGSNISDTELRELESITREVLKKCLVRCKSEYDTNPNISWNEIKEKIMNDLVTRVTTLKNSGVLPN